MYSVSLHSHGANATCCQLQTMKLGFGLGRYIYQKRYVICVACVRNTVMYIYIYSYIYIYIYVYVKCSMYIPETTTNEDYTEDLTLLANNTCKSRMPAAIPGAGSKRHWSRYVNSDKMDFMRFKKRWFHFQFFFSSYNVWEHVQYPSLISHQPGVITQFR